MLQIYMDIKCLTIKATYLCRMGHYFHSSEEEEQNNFFPSKKNWQTSISRMVRISSDITLLTIYPSNDHGESEVHFNWGVYPTLRLSWFTFVYEECFHFYADEFTCIEVEVEETLLKYIYKIFSQRVVKHFIAQSAKGKARSWGFSPLCPSMHSSIISWFALMNTFPSLDSTLLFSSRA